MDMREKDEVAIAHISHTICEWCPENMEIIDCASRVVKAAINAGITEDDLRKAINEIYGKEI